jgi:DNA-binding XRE family transcriptional regulator
MQSKSSLTQNLGKRLKSIRESKNLSQEALAQKAGVYRTYIGHIEVGKYTPSVYTLYKICRALSIDSSELLSF